MRINIYGLVLSAPRVTAYLWSPWRASALEHRIFQVVGELPGCAADDAADERRLNMRDPKAFQTALQAVARVLKGWQEEADQASERRGWRWLFEADCDADGYDHAGEPVSIWGFLQLRIDRGEPGEGDRGEHIDLEGFGIRIWGENGTTY